MVQGGVSSPELHAGHRLGRRPHSSEMEKAGEHWLSKVIPPPKQRQRDGMRVGSRGEGKGKVWGDGYTCHRGLT